MKKLLSILLSIMVCASLCTIPVFADESSSTDTDIYNYQYMGRAYEDAEGVDFRWMITDSEGNSKPYTYEDFMNHTTTHIFKLNNLSNENEEVAAYCCDFLTYIQIGSLYKRINLEDSSYFTSDVAEHIRGIMENGYWLDWTDADLAAAAAKANEWNTNNPGKFEITNDVDVPADIYDPVEQITNLTKKEALTATQLAIWGFANTPYDGTWVQFKSDDNVDNELNPNTKAFRRYLMGQTAKPANEDGILFTDEVVESFIALGTQSEGLKYDVIAKFKLAGKFNPTTDTLTFKATLDGQTIEKSLADMTVDENGYYSITFNNVENADAIALSINGTQYVNDVYFYEAQETANADERDSSQNLVGWAEGLTPVSASSLVEWNNGDETVALYKLEKETNIPLSEAVFNLYVQDDNGTYHCIKENLVTDKNGYIEVTGLPSGYKYFFKEIKAPDGYDLNSEYVEAPLWTTTVSDETTSDDEIGEIIPVVNKEYAYVYNTKTPTTPSGPHTPSNPDTPDKPTEPDTPDIPDTPDVPEVPNEPVDQPTTPNVNKDVVKVDKEETIIETEVPKTGDMTSILPYIGLLVSGLGLYFLNRKKEEN